MWPVSIISEIKYTFCRFFFKCLPSWFEMPIWMGWMESPIAYLTAVTWCEVCVWVSLCRVDRLTTVTCRVAVRTTRRTRLLPSPTTTTIGGGLFSLSLQYCRKDSLPPRSELLEWSWWWWWCPCERDEDELEWEEDRGAGTGSCWRRDLWLSHLDIVVCGILHAIRGVKGGNGFYFRLHRRHAIVFFIIVVIIGIFPLCSLFGWLVTFGYSFANWFVFLSFRCVVDWAY